MKLKHSCETKNMSVPSHSDLHFRVHVHAKSWVSHGAAILGNKTDDLVFFMITTALKILN